MARKELVTLLVLAGLALSAALGPAKTCSTGVAEEDPTAVRLAPLMCRICEDFVLCDSTNLRKAC